MSKTHQPNAIDQLKKGLSDQGLTTRSIVAFFIFGMIVVVFVLSDLTGRRKGGHDMGSAAEVNGEIISIRDFQEEQKRVSDMFGGLMEGEVQQNFVAGRAMDSLVNRSVAAQAAEKEGIYATDAEVRNMIVNDLPYFKRDGVFQSDAYKAILSQNRITPGEFEERLRRDIKNQRSRELFEAAFGLSGLQKGAEQELRSAKMNLEFVALSAAEYAKSGAVSAEDVKKALGDDAFAKRAQEYFNANQANFETPEQVRASHILIRADAKTDEQAKAKAESVLKRVQKEDFGKVAAEVSDDIPSKAKKGDLGFFGRKMMVPEFENAAFGLAVGKISSLVKTEYGYHIIKVTEKKPYAKADFATAKTEIAKKLLAEERFLSFVKSVEAAVAQGKTDELNKLISQNKMTWKETGYFDMAAESAPVMESAQAIKVALELNKSQPLAKRLVREKDTQFVVRLKDVKTEASELKDKEQSMIESQKSIAVYSAWIGSFKKSAKIETNTSLTSRRQE